MPDEKARAAGPAALRHNDLPGIVRRAVELCLERNARNTTVLDLRRMSSATDFFLVASGDSDVHVRAIAEHLLEQLGREGMRAAGVEGEQVARWILIDYIDLVVHIFHPVAREFYQLERLWGDAPLLQVEDPGS
jgi:ribosome-associated protein